MKFQNAFVVGVMALTLGNAQAALFDRGGGLLYDDVLNVTWLADANYAKTSGYDADGMMTWAKANTWAANLVHGGYDDWRLPTALNQNLTGPCVNANCTNSEMGHMFYNNLGASAFRSILSGTNAANLALITHLQSSTYWSGTAFAPIPASAWHFDANYGYQSYQFQHYEYYAWAVRPGDVAAPIPEPETYAMMLAGLGLLGLTAKRRKQQQASD
jgi:hypothetical protein